MARVSLRGHAYGVDVLSSWPISGLNPPDRLMRRAQVRFGADGEWASPTLERLVEEREPDGALFLAVDRTAQGYRVHAPRFGTQLVSSTGEDVAVSDDVMRVPGQRLLFAQTMPIAAALRGLELFHASAVELGGRVLAFTGPSGVGKSSLALHLLAAGAGLVTDDVLAVDSSDGALRVHPGPRRTSQSRVEMKRLGWRARLRVGMPLRLEDDKLVLEPARAGGSATLGTLLLVDRPADAPEIAMVPADDTGALLGSAFAPHVDTPERLHRRLEICSQIIEAGSFRRLLVPGDRSAAEVATAIRMEVQRSRYR